MGFFGERARKRTEADKRRGPVCWETNLGRGEGLFFAKRRHARLVTLQCFGSLRLIVSHKLNSAVLQPGQPLTRLYTSVGEDLFDLSAWTHIKIQPGEGGKNFWGMVHNKMNPVLHQISICLTSSSLKPKEQLKTWRLNVQRSHGFAAASDWGREGTLSYRSIALINQHSSIRSLIILLINTFSPLHCWC